MFDTTCWRNLSRHGGRAEPSRSKASASAFGARQPARRPRRRLARLPGRLVYGADRPVRLRQVDAAAHRPRPGEPDAGTVTVGGETPAAVRKRGEIGIAFQDPALLPWRSVADNIALPLDVLGRDQSAARARIPHLIALVGLGGFERPCRASCPAACASASRSPARWSPSPTCS